jgi:hypothetical protein
MSNEPSHTLADTSAAPPSSEKPSVSEQPNGSGTFLHPVVSLVDGTCMKLCRN